MQKIAYALLQIRSMCRVFNSGASFAVKFDEKNWPY